ncbi:hypothetical protein AC579_8543 [Pseudocercospora musae]|uniref:CAF1-domain-containing protein n=1 Tax=Pseudocercospora musae TaxID=113226 RepID=A0A139I8J7_9PEZI|nr:hypothetical protein AC579_8543 [Pseudocercospora musae]
MDVNKTSFYPLLPDILTDISKAHFVAIDLELSGIPSHAAWGAGKRTLDERYRAVKLAAERYQILQIGLTCVEQDVLNDRYILRPYNFDLCPLIYEKGLDVERNFSFQSGAGEFLMSVGFDMNKPFRDGVPYLSRSEARQARESFEKRQKRGNIADIHVKPTEIETLAFMHRVRREVQAWVDSKNVATPEYLNIAPAGADADALVNAESPEMPRLEKRLVHQLVRAEFPELVTLGRRNFVQIVKFDQEREHRIAVERRERFEAQIDRQKGFRWIIEAMHGSNIATLDLMECAKDAITGEPIFADMDTLKANFFRAQNLLRGCPRVIVGHNCFLDMVYIYHTFIGPLPDTVGEFQQKLHELWPMLIDTKYMSTHNCGDIPPMSSLEQIADQLKHLETPVVETDGHHRKYSDTTPFHEAGYDSFLTAQVAVRLSAKLEAEGAYVDVNAAQNGVAGMKLTDAALNALNTSPAGTTNGTKDENAPPNEGFTPSVPGAKWKRRGDDTIGQADPNDPFYRDPKDLKWRHIPNHITVKDGMPAFNSDFWRVYGNKLRAFGTVEEVCNLDGASTTPTSDEGGGVEVDT